MVVIDSPALGVVSDVLALAPLVSKILAVGGVGNHPRSYPRFHAAAVLAGNAAGVDRNAYRPRSQQIHVLSPTAIAPSE